MTKQETFNLVVSALLAQGRPSVGVEPIGGFNRCRYRGDDGCKCAVGHLIPDDKYDPAMEGGAMVREVDELGDGGSTHCHAAKLLWDVVVAQGGHDPELCADLQDAHDGGSRTNDTFDWMSPAAKAAHWREYFELHAAIVAKKHYLSAAVLYA